MTVRIATTGDAQGIRQVHRAAFPTDLEADLVERLERNGDAVISLVAEEEGAIVGHILFSRMMAQADGRELSALGLAPVAVRPERQGSGVGASLIEEGISAARQSGTEMLFVLGEPAYYGRFGFDAGTAKPFASPYAGPYFQAMALQDGFSTPASGRADYARAFAEIER